MDREAILNFITQVETEDIDPVNVARAYATALVDMQSRITDQDLQRLLLVGAAMFRNSIKGTQAEMQLPPEPEEVDPRYVLEAEPFKGVLH
ncbi:hypothetical protein [Noviherbaspirillum aridicola]|uniref:Phage gp6-like head-tail connector protein n=1 Tax=Noviherbaspirillum aridicola TaxID=2849687 RepID=A0ABQ4Q558_9BURK|nr:hypothetical protein [Noviherbaspirillum aridicola]GIZ52239.1 hypothetical protein NCCP691_22530 [Noviherbaspirillum aridicola]